jgi:uncharacterized membrane protein
MPVSSRLRRDRRGIVTIVFALTAPLLLGCAGLGVDVVFWYRDAARLQQIADRAALSAAAALAGGGPVEPEGVAAAVARADAEPDMTVSAGPPFSGPHVGNPLAVEVVMAAPQRRFFARLFLGGEGGLTRRAVALGQPKQLPAARLVE